MYKVKGIELKVVRVDGEIKAYAFILHISQREHFYFTSEEKTSIGAWRDAVQTADELEAELNK